MDTRNLFKQIIITFFLSFCMFGNIAHAQWTQTSETINGENISDGFGFSMAMNSDATRLVSYDYGYDHETLEDAGRIRVFELNGLSWEQLGQDIVGEISEYFGGTKSKNILDMNEDGSRIIVGAMHADEIDGFLGFKSGVAKVYEWNGTEWNQVGQTIIGTTNHDNCGSAVSITPDGGTIAVGATGHDGNGNASGHVRIYKLSGNSWNQVGEDIQGEISGEFSGSAISLDEDGSRVAIGSPRNNELGFGTGQIRVYEFVENAWVQLGQDLNGALTAGGFGADLSLSYDGNILATGTFSATVNSFGIGLATMYKYVQGSWVQLGQQLINSDPVFFGSEVNLRADGLCVAVSGEGNNAHGQTSSQEGTLGQVSVYHFDGQAWVQFGQTIEAETIGFAFGWTLGFSSDGSTIAVAAPFDGINDDSNGFIKVFASGFVGVKESTLLADFKVYPNPTQGHLVIEFERLQNLDVRLLSTAGQILKRQKIINTEKFDFNIDGPNGIYFIELIDEEQRSAVFEVVKEER